MRHTGKRKRTPYQELLPNPTKATEEKIKDRQLDAQYEIKATKAAKTFCSLANIMKKHQHVDDDPWEADPEDSNDNRYRFIITVNESDQLQIIAGNGHENEEYSHGAIAKHVFDTQTQTPAPTLLFAGTVTLDEDGQITKIDNKSGHYQTPAELLETLAVPFLIKCGYIDPNSESIKVIEMTPVTKNINGKAAPLNTYATEEIIAEAFDMSTDDNYINPNIEEEEAEAAPLKKYEEAALLLFEDEDEDEEEELDTSEFNRYYTSSTSSSSGSRGKGIFSLYPPLTGSTPPGTPPPGTPPLGTPPPGTPPGTP